MLHFQFMVYIEIKFHGCNKQRSECVKQDLHIYMHTCHPASVTWFQDSLRYSRMTGVEYVNYKTVTRRIYTFSTSMLEFTPNKNLSLSQELKIYYTWDTMLLVSHFVLQESCIVTLSGCWSEPLHDQYQACHACVLFMLVLNDAPAQELTTYGSSSSSHKNRRNYIARKLQPHLEMNKASLGSRTSSSAADAASSLGCNDRVPSLRSEADSSIFLLIGEGFKFTLAEASGSSSRSVMAVCGSSLSAIGASTLMSVSMARRQGFNYHR